MARQTIAQAFADAKERQTPAFVAYVPCGYKTKADTVEILLALERGGASIIELGIPYSDPQADGPTIQKAHQVGVDQGITLPHVLEVVTEARSKGLTLPLVLMGYYNNILQYGEERMCKSSAEAGVDGFIIVDLPAGEAKTLTELASAHSIDFISLVSPTTTEERMKDVAKVARGFVYCVSVNGVTGARESLPEGIEAFMSKVRSHLNLPLALGFGLSTREHFMEASKYADGVVMGSKIVKVIEEAGDSTQARADAVEKFCKSIVQG